MTFDEFCTLNGERSHGTFVMLDHIIFPSECFETSFTLVMYVSKGSGEMTIDDRHYTISRRYMCVLRTGQTISGATFSDDFNCEVLLIGGDLAQELNISSPFLSLFVLNEHPILQVTNEFAASAKIFYATFAKVGLFADNPYKDECLKSILRAFFYSTGYYIFKSLGFRGNHLFEVSVDIERSDDSVLSRFIKLLEENAKRNRTLSFYAERLGYNPKYLSSMIKRETGYSGQYLINQYALLEAMAKLRYSLKSIKEISNDMEFPSQSDFGKFFKKMTGVSPMTYRKTRRIIRR